MRLSRVISLILISLSIGWGRPLTYLFEKYSEDQLSKGVEVKEDIEFFSENIFDSEFKEIEYSKILNSNYNLIFGDTPYA